VLPESLGISLSYATCHSLRELGFEEFRLYSSITFQRPGKEHPRSTQGRCHFSRARVIREVKGSFPRNTQVVKPNEQPTQENPKDAAVGLPRCIQSFGSLSPIRYWPQPESADRLDEPIPFLQSSQKSKIACRFHPRTRVMHLVILIVFQGLEGPFQRTLRLEAKRTGSLTRQTR
jgi:hypothetical protein